MIGYIIFHNKLIERAGNPYDLVTTLSTQTGTWRKDTELPNLTISVDGKSYTGFTQWICDYPFTDDRALWYDGITSIYMDKLNTAYSSVDDMVSHMVFSSDVTGTNKKLTYAGGQTTLTDNLLYKSYLGDYITPASDAHDDAQQIGWKMYVCDDRDADVAGKTYSVTANLTNITADTSNPVTVKDGAEFTLNFTANSHYQINSATSNIGTVTISSTKKSFTVTGTATEDIVVTASAVLDTFNITVEGTNYHADDSNPTVLTYGQPWSVTYYADSGYRIMTANCNYINADIKYAGTPTTSVTMSYGSASKDLKVILTVVESPVTPTYTVTENLTNVTADSDNVKSVSQGESFTLKYTVNDGYTLDSYTTNVGNISVSGNTITVTGTATANIVVTISASIHKVTVPVQATLGDGVVADSGNVSEVETGATFVLKYNLADGYQNISATTTVGVAVINDAKTQAVISGQAGSDPIIVAVSAQKIPDVYVISKEELTHAYADDSNPTQFAKGSPWTLIYHADENYRILDANCNYINATIEYSGTPRDMVMISADSATKDITVTVTGVYAPTKFYCHITGKFEHATCNYTDGELLDSSKPIIITAESGYEFKETYTLTKTREDKENETGTFEKNSDRTMLTYSLEGNTWNITLDDDYVATVPVSTLSGFTNLYKVDNDILYELSKKRITQVKITNGEMIDTGEEQIIDYGDFITALYIIPYELPSTMLGSNTSIILGTLDSNIRAPILKNYKYTAHLGSITVPLKYNNVYDYINTTCTARVPFFGDVVVANEYAIGQTLTFDMVLDMYSGNATLNITSSFTNGIVYSTTKNIAMQVPFIQGQNNTVINSLSSIYKNISDKVSLEVVRNVPYYADNTFGRDSMECVTLSEKHGYVEVDSCNVVGNATADEKDKIKNLLKNGVYLPEAVVTKSRKRSKKVTI